jgi:hypothetical protein
MTFASGAPIIWRSITSGVVATVRASRVVRDDATVALTVLPGFPYMQRTGKRGGPGGRVLLEWDGGHRERAWIDNRVLILYSPGDAYSVELFWRAADDAFLGWHVNLQLPWRRTTIGFDSRDLLLDVVVRPDRTAHWKDEDELTFALQRGTITDAEVQIARDAGERAMDRAARREPPFDDSMVGWRPDPTWTTPTLPNGWARHGDDLMKLSSRDRA